jgi:hypothetical protein
MYTNGLRALITLLLLYVLNMPLSYAQQNPFNEFQAKADSLLRFSQIMNWPDSTFDKAESPIRICFLDQQPLNHFDSLLLGKKVKERSIKVLHFLETENALTKLESCHVLFISQSQQHSLTKILAYTQQYPILTISEIEDFVLEGGMLQLYTLDNTMRFMFDPQTIEEAGITIQMY